MSTQTLRTVLGDISPDEIRLVLPHEHLFTDLRGPEAINYAQADPKQVLLVMLPFLKQAHDAGVSMLVECSTIGVGRNIEILQRLAENTRIRIMAPTGLYRDDYVPAEYRESTLDEITDLFILELTKGIGRSLSKAGFIKIAVSDDGIHPLEVRNIRAAARASLATGAAVASHTIGGRNVLDEIKILEDEGMDLEKFIWVHASSELDQDFHIQAAELGVYVEFDSIGNEATDSQTLAAVLNLIGKGYRDRVLLSHDAGWFQPGRPGGEPEHGIRGYTALIKDFLPTLQRHGVDEETINQITIENPINAFAIND